MLSCITQPSGLETDLEKGDLVEIGGQVWQPLLEMGAQAEASAG